MKIKRRKPKENHPWKKSFKTKANQEEVKKKRAQQYGPVYGFVGRA